MYLAPNGTCQSCGDYCAECRPDGSCAKCWPNDSWTEDYTEPTFLIVRAPNGTCAKVRAVQSAGGRRGQLLQLAPWPCLVPGRRSKGPCC